MIRYKRYKFSCHIQYDLEQNVTNNRGITKVKGKGIHYLPQGKYPNHCSLWSENGNHVTCIVSFVYLSSSSAQTILALSRQPFEKLVGCDHGGCRHGHWSPPWSKPSITSMQPTFLHQVPYGLQCRQRASLAIFFSIQNL